MKPLNLEGMRFGRLIAIKRIGSKNGFALWLCRCDCGNTKDVVTALLTTNRTMSCGCLATESKRSPKTHGMSGSRVYTIWCGMISRCRLPNRKGAKNYVGKGVKVCQRWENFGNFLHDMGEPTEGMTIERNNSDGDYSPDNCRWATRREQRHNTSDALFVEFKGVHKPLSVLADEFGIKYHTLYARVILKGMPLNQALYSGDMRKYPYLAHQSDGCISPASGK